MRELVIVCLMLIVFNLLLNLGLYALLIKMRTRLDALIEEVLDLKRRKRLQPKYAP